MDNKQQYITLKPYTQSELSALYNVSEKVFRNWLKPYRHEIGKRYGRCYTLKQVIEIFNRLGIPGLYIPRQRNIPGHTQSFKDEANLCNSIIPASLHSYRSIKW